MKLLRAIACLVSFPLYGCGTYVPDLQDPYEPNTKGSVMVQQIEEHLQCEVEGAIQDVILNDQDLVTSNKALNAKYGSNLPEKTLFDEIKRKWSAQVTLTLTVDEKTNFNPSAAFNSIYTNYSTFFPHSTVVSSQTFSLALAGAFSSDATRKETTSFHINFKDFTDAEHLAKARQARKEGTFNCDTVGGHFIDSDLKIKDWANHSLLAARVKNGVVRAFLSELSEEEKLSKKDVLSDEITFVVIYGANMTPTLKLVDLSAGQNSMPFLGAQRTNTQDALITMGPSSSGKDLSPLALSTIQAAQNEIAFRNAIISTQH